GGPRGPPGHVGQARRTGREGRGPEESGIPDHRRGERNLIGRSGFSFKAVGGSLEEVASRLVEVGARTLALTDANSTHGHVKATAVAEKHGLRMVYGVD